MTTGNRPFICIPNWERFQHYKDRNPTWIKLYPELLSDPEFNEMPESTRLLLVQIWMLYASSRGKVPSDTRYLSYRLSMRVRQNQLDLLTERGWITLVPARPSSDLNFRAWPSRYIPDATRYAVLERDGCCQQCGETENLEIDHIIPVSRWNEDGDPDLKADDLSNLQVLCRSCNRRKNRYEQPEHLRSNSGASRASAPSREEEKEEEKDPLTPAERGNSRLNGTNPRAVAKRERRNSSLHQFVERCIREQWPHTSLMEELTSVYHLAQEEAAELISEFTPEETPTA